MEEREDVEVVGVPVEGVEYVEVVGVPVDVGDDVEGVEVVEDIEFVEVLMEGVEEVEDEVVQMEVVEDEVVQMEVVEDMEFVEVQMDGGDDVEGVEVVEVQMDEVQAELEFEDMLDELQPDVDEEFRPLAVDEQPRGRAPIIDRQAGVTHPLPERHNAGALNRICTQCNARHFEGEVVGRDANRHFSTCCNNGQVTAAGQHALLPAPFLLMSLLIGDSQDSRRFRDDIRRYNNALAFAAFSCGTDDRRLRGRGPRTMCIQGQTYQRINNDVAVDRVDANYCQLYFLESAEANTRRVGMALQRNQRELSVVVMGLLDGFLRDVNPYAMAFKNMREVWLAERDLADADPAGVRPRPVTMHFVRDAARDDGRNNLPTANEVAAVFVGEGGRPPRDINLVIYDTNPINPQHRMQTIPAGSCHSDPMLYPLFFPYGEAGWHNGMLQAGNRRNNVRNRNSIRAFASYRLAVRYQGNNDQRHELFSLLHQGRFLLQMYVCDQYVRMESNNLNYIRLHQRDLLAEAYQGLMDHVNQQLHVDPMAVGRRVILPSTFTGSDRFNKMNYQDAITIVRTKGKPDLFITFTCNPRWPEITENLAAHSTASDRPDLVARVFNRKLQELIGDITVNRVFGNVGAYVYTIEFQKRGLPHAHILIILAEDCKFRTAEDVDGVVCAFLPDPAIDRRLLLALFAYLLELYNNNNTNHNTRRYVNSRYVSPPEGIWRLFSYKLHGKSHTVVRLPVHLEGRQNVYFAPGQAEERLQNQAVRSTKLTQFFALNTTDVNARQYLYQEIPTHYTWQMPRNQENVLVRNVTQWLPRRIRMANVTLARMYIVNPLDRDRFHLRLLLLNRRGPKSFQDIRTVDGVVHETFTAAAVALGLLEDDRAWRGCLTESATLDTPRQLRYLFVTILVFCEPSNPLALYEANEANMMEDFNRRLQDVDRARATCLAAIEDLLRVHRKSPGYYGLPLADPRLLEPLQDDALFRAIDAAARWAPQVDALNAEQRTMYDRVMAAVDDQREVAKTFFVDGPGGTGKTTLYGCLIWALRHRPPQREVLCVAFTGNAASLMDGGMTVHSTFGLPFGTLTEDSTSSVTMQSERAQKIRNAALIVWDEAPMSPGLRWWTACPGTSWHRNYRSAVKPCCSPATSGRYCPWSGEGHRDVAQKSRSEETTVQRILGGEAQDDDIVVPKIPLTSSGEDDLPILLRRLQFPVRLSFAMTINKSQGQTFDRVGLLLTSPVFTHGQLYVAFSRVRNAQSVRVGMYADDSGRFVTKNIVYREVL
ncbi:uncharacterized protein LOC132932954 [Metopolophium dirhodum]|uniref:uncharacterized protein LOC132932954 n=1 Tax=Metopolophium dirhodum TaxID=44670 RepID=UPI0029906364|nr:uncharacterized protein LOC132932954 [Metopolophium dirhodum]